MASVSAAETAPSKLMEVAMTRGRRYGDFVPVVMSSGGRFLVVDDFVFFLAALEGEEVAAVAGEDVALVVDLDPREGRERADVALAGRVFDEVVDVVVVGEGDVPAAECGGDAGGAEAAAEVDGARGGGWGIRCVRTRSELRR